VFILKIAKVLCFDTLLQVFIPKVLTLLGILENSSGAPFRAGEKFGSPLLRTAESGRYKKKAASPRRAAAEFKAQFLTGIVCTIPLDVAS
jgi:hypothetical protein